MIFTDLAAGDAVFVDANTLIYHFTNHPKYGPACTTLVERIEQKEITGFTSSHCLADVAHRIMTIEAMGRPVGLAGFRLGRTAQETSCGDSETPPVSAGDRKGRAIGHPCSSGIRAARVGGDQFQSTIRAVDSRCSHRGRDASAWSVELGQRGRGFR